MRLLLALVLLTGVASAQPRRLPVQGALRSAAGLPVSDGNYGLTLSLYADQAATTPLYTEVHVAVAVTDSVFSVELGSLTPLDGALFQTGPALVVGITVEAEPELPRSPLRYVPYAVRADSADSLRCSGCVTADALDVAVLAPYAKTTDLAPYAKTTDLAPYAKTADLGPYAKAADLAPYAKTVDLAPYALLADLVPFARSADLAPVATSGSYNSLTGTPTLVGLPQTCALGAVVTGVTAAGALSCAQDKDTTYTGANFALSAQGCSAGSVVTGVAANGTVTCSNSGAVPIGSIVAFHSSLSGTPSLPAGWMTCNGQTVNDAASPYNGVALPNLNGTNNFLRGATTSGATGGSETHVHTFGQTATDLAPDASNASNGSFTNPANHLPPYMTVVWIIRVK